MFGAEEGDREAKRVAGSTKPYGRLLYLVIKDNYPQ